MGEDVLASSEALAQNDAAEDEGAGGVRSAGEDRGGWLRAIGRILTAFGIGANITPVIGWLLGNPALFLGRISKFLGQTSGLAATAAQGTIRGGTGGIVFALFKSELPESIIEWVLVILALVAGVVAPLVLIVLLIAMLVFAIF